MKPVRLSPEPQPPGQIPIYAYSLCDAILFNNRNEGTPYDFIDSSFLGSLALIVPARTSIAEPIDSLSSL